MEGLRAHATDWTQNIQNMSVDFRIAGKLDDPFKRRRRKRRRGPRSHGTNHSAAGTVVPGEGRRKDKGSDSQSESGSYSSYTTTSNESDFESESESSESTQTERVPDVLESKPVTQPSLSQPLDYFGENLAFIDESSDAVSGKLHLDPLLDRPESKSHRAKRRHHRRKKTPKSSPTKHSGPNGDIVPPENPPPPPPPLDP